MQNSKLEATKVYKTQARHNGKSNSKNLIMI